MWAALLYFSMISFVGSRTSATSGQQLLGQKLAETVGSLLGWFLLSFLQNTIKQNNTQKFTWVRVGRSGQRSMESLYKTYKAGATAKFQSFMWVGLKLPVWTFIFPALHTSDQPSIHPPIPPRLSPEGNGIRIHISAHFCLHSCISLWDLCLFTQSLKYFIQSNRTESMPILFTLQKIKLFTLFALETFPQSILNSFIVSQQNRLWDTFINHRELWMEPWASVTL